MLFIDLMGEFDENVISFIMLEKKPGFEKDYHNMFLV